MEQILMAIVLGLWGIAVVVWWVVKIAVIIAVAVVVLVFTWYALAFLVAILLELWDSIVH